MQIRNVEVWIETCEVYGNLTYAVCSIDQAEDVLFSTDLRELLEWMEYSRHADDGVEDGQFGSLALLFDVRDSGLELLQQFCIGDWVGEVYTSTLDRRSLGEVLDCLLASSVDSREVDDDVSWLVDQIPQDDVHSCRGIGHEDYGLDWGIEVLGHSFPRFVDLARICVANEAIWLAFDFILKRAKFCSHSAWVCAEGPFKISACGHIH